MDEHADTQPFEFEVAGVAHLSRYGVVVYGWYRSGSVRPGDLVVAARLTNRPTKLTGAGFLCKGPAGGPDGQLLLEDQDLAGQLIAGDRIRAWGSA